MQKLVIVDRKGFGVTVAPCDPKTLVELPIGSTPGQWVKCPICRGKHKIAGVNYNAKLE